MLLYIFFVFKHSVSVYFNNLKFKLIIMAGPNMQKLRPAMGAPRPILGTRFQITNAVKHRTFSWCILFWDNVITHTFTQTCEVPIFSVAPPGVSVEVVPKGMYELILESPVTAPGGQRWVQGYGFTARECDRLSCQWAVTVSVGFCVLNEAQYWKWRRQ